MGKCYGIAARKHCAKNQPWLTLGRYDKASMNPCLVVYISSNLSVLSVAAFYTAGLPLWNFEGNTRIELN